MKPGKHEISPTVMDQQVRRRTLFAVTLGAAFEAVIAACGRPSNSPSPGETSRSGEYPVHRNIIATFFWLGEPASKENAHIPNMATEWDGNAVENFGGVDNPKRRNADGSPAGFRPKFNPRYFAVPASEINRKGIILGARERSPWVNEAANLADDRSLFKGRWAKITNVATSQVTYGQWVDTGPSDNEDGADDYDYVFGDGSQRPKNEFGEGAGIDLSPMIGADFGITDVSESSLEVDWEFIDEQDVPDEFKEFPLIDNLIRG